jgi:2-polyprenyl-3-methyl-5-hydroxy-6-metoxy-1,4-benzoquinol methylase
MSYSIDPEGLETQAIHELVDFSGADVLEVGCGDGRLTWRYAAKTASVVGLDPDEDKIRRANEATPESLRSKVSFVAADVTDHEVPVDAYDVVVLAHSL